MSHEHALGGCRVLVTRPQHQAPGLVRSIEKAGGRALCLPTIAIVPLAEGESAAPRAARPDGVIFVSPNAVEHGKGLLRELGATRAPPIVGAVGAATARALAAAGIRVDLVPEEGADSEALLAHPDLQGVAGKRFLIVRGKGGRELLATTLRDRGADVQYAEVYRRAIPVQGRERLRDWLGAGAIDVVTATSAAGLQNLLELAGPELARTLCGLPLVVVSERMLKLAEGLGFTGSVKVAAGAGDAAVTEAVIALWA